MLAQKVLCREGGVDVYGQIRAALADHGLMVRGGLYAEGLGTIVLVGTAGSAFWPHFLAARRHESDPLDSWSCRVMAELAERFGGRALMPNDGPPFLPFQRWAMAAEPVFPSPMGVLVHPIYGLWHSYRGALVFADALAVPPRVEAANPCDTCTARPCAAACPVAAAVPYDVPRCMDHLNGGGACRTIGCLARHACPLGQDYAYTPEHASFHMDAFVSAVWA